MNSNVDSNRSTDNDDNDDDDVAMYDGVRVNDANKPTGLSDLRLIQVLLVSPFALSLFLYISHAMFSRAHDRSKTQEINSEMRMGSFFSASLILVALRRYPSCVFVFGISNVILVRTRARILNPIRTNHKKLIIKFHCFEFREILQNHRPNDFSKRQYFSIVVFFDTQYFPRKKTIPREQQALLHFPVTFSIERRKKKQKILPHGLKNLAPFLTPRFFIRCAA